MWMRCVFGFNPATVGGEKQHDSKIGDWWGGPGSFQSVCPEFLCLEKNKLIRYAQCAAEKLIGSVMCARFLVSQVLPGPQKVWKNFHQNQNCEANEDVSDVSLFSQEESSGLLRARCRILRDNIEGAKLRFVDLKVCKRTSCHKGSMKKERWEVQILDANLKVGLRSMEARTGWYSEWIQRFRVVLSRLRPYMEWWIGQWILEFSPRKWFSGLVNYDSLRWISARKCLRQSSTARLGSSLGCHG